MFGQYGQPNQLRKNMAGKRGRWLIGSLGAFAAALQLIVGASLLPASLHDLLILLSLPFLIAGLYFGLIWKRWIESITVEDALRRDPRPPILYLRPFRADRIRFSSWRQRRVAIVRRLTFVAYILVIGWLVALVLGLYRLITKGSDANPLERRKPSAEQFFVSLLDPLGPVIAIGRPGERTPPVGAARMYLGEEWKDVVCELLKRSQLVLLFAGHTPHFAWELQQVFQNDPFVPTIMMLPFFQRYRQREVDRFVNIFTNSTGLHLSSNLRKTRAAFFPASSEAIEIRDLDTDDDRALNALNPFLGPIAQIMEISRPGWTEPYIEEARSSRTRDKIWMIFSAAALILIGFLISSVIPWMGQINREADRAQLFFEDALQGRNPCADTKLATLSPDPSVCLAAFLETTKRKSDLCLDPRFGRIFPDPGPCHYGASRAYAHYLAQKKR